MITTTRELSATGAEPVTLAEAKLWLKIDDDQTTDDATVVLLISAMRIKAEQITGRALTRRTMELRMDQFPSSNGIITLPYPPLISVEYIRYVDSAGAEQELSGSPDAFQTDSGSVPGRVYPLYASDWPSALEAPSSVRVGFTCGYSSQSQVSRLVRLWIQARISTAYQMREMVVTTGVNALPHDFADGLLDELRVNKMFA